MAEALAADRVASSIVQLLDFTAKVTVRLCNSLHDSNDSPETLRTIVLELPFFVVALRETKSHLDLEFYGPSAVAAIQRLVDECTSLMAILEDMLGNFVHQKDDSKMARSRKAVYGVTHEKVIPTILSKLSGYTEKLLLYQNATSRQLLRQTLVKSIERLLEDRLLLGPLPMATYSAGNETLQNPMKDGRIARRKNRTTHSSQYNRRFPSSIDLSRLGLLWAIRIPLNLLLEARSYTLCPSLQLQRLVKRTSPGFEVFWKCDNHYMDVSDGLVELRRIFQDRRASPFDADPDGRNWLELLFDFRGGGDQAVRLEFLKMIGEYNPQINASIPIQRLCFPILTHALPNPGELAALNTNLVIEEGDDGVNFLKIFFHQYPHWTRGIGDIQSEDPFYLKFIRKCSEYTSGLWNQTPLMDAILFGVAADIDSCINRKVPLDSRNSFGQAAMHLAVLRPSELLRLIRAGAEVDIKDNAGATPLCYAICYGCTESMMLLLEAGTSAFLTKESESQLSTCLHYAFSTERWEVVKSFFSHIQTSKRFLEKGFNHLADYYVANWLEPLEPHKRFMSPPGISVLLESGISPDVTSKSGTTLLHCAVGLNEVQALFQAGFTKIDQFDVRGNSPLMNAFYSYVQSEDAYKAILAQGVDVNLRNTRGISAMHIICENIGCPYPKHPDELSNLETLSRKFETAAICLSHGADTLARDKCSCPCSVNGCSPTTFLLRRLRLDCRGHLLALEWLLMLKEYQNINVAEAALTDLVRAIQFAMLGMTHLCCGGYENTDGPRFEQNKIDEILDTEKHLKHELEEFMLNYEKRPDRSIEASWVFVLPWLNHADCGPISEEWSVGTWQPSCSQTFTPLSTPPWKSLTELVRCWSSKKDHIGPAYCFVDKSNDEFRVARQFAEWKIKSSEFYSKWVEYVFEHKERFEFPKPLDEEWLKTRQKWAAQQAKAIEATEQNGENGENSRFEVLDEGVPTVPMEDESE